MKSDNFNIDSIVRVKSDHKFHPSREGIILFFGEEASAGVVVLRDIKNSSDVFAVNINDIVND